MSSNKEAKEKLIQVYGPECFIDKLHLRPEESKVYTGKQLAYMKKHEKELKRLTYHHILERSKGGKATFENGALLSEGNHRWFNQQSKEAQDKMNEIFQEYKKCGVVLVEKLDLGIELKMITFEIPEERPKEKYNRAKEKRELRRIIEEEVELE